MNKSKAGARSGRKTGLKKFMRALAQFRDLNPDMPIQQVMTFCLILIKDTDVRMADISKELDLSQSSASRVIAAFTELNFRKEQGHDLLKFTPDPMNMRQKNIYLTSKGKAFERKLLNMLEGCDGH